MKKINGFFGFLVILSKRFIQGGRLNGVYADLVCIHLSNFFKPAQIFFFRNSSLTREMAWLTNAHIYSFNQHILPLAVLINLQIIFSYFPCYFKVSIFIDFHIFIKSNRSRLRFILLLIYDLIHKRQVNSPVKRRLIFFSDFLCPFLPQRVKRGLINGRYFSLICKISCKVIGIISLFIMMNDCWYGQRNTIFL